MGGPPNELHQLLWDYEKQGDQSEHVLSAPLDKPVTPEALQAALSALPSDEAARKLGEKDQVRGRASYRLG